MWIRTLDGIILKQISNVNYEGIIKKQGDNLIDVLEVGDIIFSNEYNESGVITRIDKSTVNTRNTNWEIRFIDKVITHEQYMPLAQEVNNG